jgi:WD40 repeat protein
VIELFYLDDIVCCSIDDAGVICHWNTNSGELVQTSRIECKALTSASFCRQTKQLVVGGNFVGSFAVAAIDVMNGKTLRFLSESLNHYSVAIAPNSSWRAATGEDFVQMWDVNGLCRTLRFEKIGYGSGGMAIAFSPAAEHVAFSCSDMSVRVFSCADGKELRSLKRSFRVATNLRFASDGTHLIAADEGAQQESEITVWNYKTGSLIFSHHSNERVGKAIAILSDCRAFIATGGDGVIKVIEY